MDVPTLLGLGLDEHLAEVWMAMAAAPGAGVRELAEMVGISEPRVRELLDDLGDRALIRASRQSPGLLVPIAPEAALAQLMRREQEEIAAQQRRIEARRDRIMRGIAAKVAVRVTGDGIAPFRVLAGAGAHTCPGSHDGAIEPIIGDEAIQARYEELADATTLSADCLMPVAQLSESAIAELWPRDAKLLRRGVRLRSLYLEAIHDDAPTADYAHELQAAGAQVRTSPTLPQRLFVSDRRVALVPLAPAVHGHGAVVIRAPGVVAALLELFDSVWHNAAPLDIGRPADAVTGLSDTERMLLHIFADGASDERAAKKLGVSLRTVRRIMADLMHRLEASSRFEAGIKAAKRGWL